MSQRVSWTNNSSGHDGTYVYRATSPMDPQNLPAPIATVAPVAQGQTAEYIDSEDLPDGTYYYRVQDYDETGVGAVSDEQSLEIGFTASVGDYVEGGVYAGVITYGDGREFHIIAAVQSDEFPSSDGYGYGYYGTATGATDEDDGKANLETIRGLGFTGEMFGACDNLSIDGFTDWYPPAVNELNLLADLAASGHAEFSTSTNFFRLSSTEVSSTKCWGQKFDGSAADSNIRKDYSYTIRPVRRIAV